MILEGMPITDLTADSRSVVPGMTFAAYPGDRTDGRQFIPQAIERGAASVIWESENFQWAPQWSLPNRPVPELRRHISEIAGQVFGNPSHALWMVGLTGTNGKTSCSHWLAHLLQRHGKPCAVVGTVGNGLLDALEPSANTTPDAIVLQKSLARYLAEGAQACAMEVSSHGLVQHRVAGIAFDGAVFTNLSRDHLDYHGSMEAYGAAKEMLFHFPGLKFAVINLDDAFGAQLARRLVGVIPQLVGYTQRDDCAEIAGLTLLQACHVHLGSAGMQFEVKSPLGTGQVSSPLLGRFNVSNLLAVLGAAIMSGIALPEACAGISSLSAPPGRLERVGGEGKPSVVIDYAHTPDALEKALATLRESVAPGHRLVCVFGCGGERDPGKRPLMGAVASRWADRLVLTSDNPRSESVDAILDQIAAGVSIPFERIPDRSIAIGLAIAEATSGDVVLIAGKGHEDYQEIAGRRLPFSDRAVAESALAGGRA
jgi:UDP-N-acetylmuramoyl-L-alanyl-D-glutamate--2,6-diaminopimelate ligase